MDATPVPWYEVSPRQSDAPGVLFLHSAWGFTDWYRTMCDRLAEAGFFVVAPDLFDGATATTWDEARLLRSRRTRHDRWTVIARATAHLRRRIGPRRLIGVVGISMGGNWALFLAQREEIPVAATVVLYAVRGGDYRDSRSAFQFHLAADDVFVSPARLRRLTSRLEQADRPAEYHSYAGTRHGFCDEGHASAYDPSAAELAWKRTEAFLHHHLLPVSHRRPADSRAQG